MAERDPFADYDAAYLFGSLSVADRAAYEAHLTGCPGCRDGLASFAGLPGLLAQVPVEQIVSEQVDGPVPESLLPRLLAEVSRDRRKVRTRTLVGGLLAAACVVAALLFALRPDGERSIARPPSTSTVASTTGSPAPTGSAGPAGVAMRVVAATDLRATVAVQSVAWGTKIVMWCTYPAAVPGTGRYQDTGYQLRVVDRDGSDSVVARWNAVAGKTVPIEGDSQLDRSDLSRIEVVNPQGAVVLELTL